MALLNRFAIQLYSIREETEKDFAAALAMVAGAGYTGVEFAGYGGLPAEEMKALLQKHGLAAVGSHIGLERLEQHFEEECAYNRTLGTGTLVVPWSDIKTMADTAALAQRLAALAPKVKQAGFGFAYHNHAHEFVQENGAYLLDALLAQTPADMGLELDVYWAAYAGVDVLAYIEKQAARLALVHLKQMADYESRRCVDLDEGVLDFAAIIAAAQKAGVEDFILEQEAFEVSARQSIEKGFKHIMAL